MIYLRSARPQGLPELADRLIWLLGPCWTMSALPTSALAAINTMRTSVMHSCVVSNLDLVTPGFVMIVAVDRAPPQGHASSGGKRIRGYGVWERLGSGVDAVRWQQQQNGWWHGASPVAPLLYSDIIAVLVGHIFSVGRGSRAVPMGLGASLMGSGLYKRPGFRTVNRMGVLPGLTVETMLWQDTGDQQSVPVLNGRRISMVSTR